MQTNVSSAKKFFYDNWLTLLITLQPLLDALAFWTQNERGTAAGAIRLIIMLVLPIVLLIKLKGKRRMRLFLALAAVGVICVMHVINGLRVGNYMLATDVAYMLRVAQMPVLAICFIFCMDNDSKLRQAERGMLTAAAIELAILLISVLTGTANSTYADGVGLSGWVIDSNRCAMSIIISVLAMFSAFYMLKGRELVITLGVLLAVFAVLLANGTKACYLTFIIICVCGMIMLVIRFLAGDRGELKRDMIVAAALALLCVASIRAYDVTPRVVEDSRLAVAYINHDEFIRSNAPDMDGNNTNAPGQSGDKASRSYVEWMYSQFVPADVIDRFGVDRVIAAAGATEDVKTLMDARYIKRTYAKIVWDGSDTLTKLFGFQFSEMNTGEVTYDLENDWHAILYYYGYVGFAAYVGFLLFILIMILRHAMLDLRGTVSVRNMGLTVMLAVELGLAQFSGAILRRPNVSIYLALTAAMLYYINVTDFREKRKAMLEEGI